MDRDAASRYRRLAALHRAGVAWTTAVGDVLGPSAADRIRRGSPLHEVLVPDPAPLDRALIEAGDASGQLGDVLERLATRHELLARTRSSAARALAYPLVLAHVGALLMAVPDWVAGRPIAGLRWSVAVLALAWGLHAGARHLLSPGAGTGTPRRSVRRRWWNAGRVLDADVRALLALADAHDAGIRLDRASQLAADAGAGGRVAADLVIGADAVRRGRLLSSAWHATPESIRAELVTAEGAGNLSAACRHGAARLGEDATSWRTRIEAMVPTIGLLAIGALIAARLLAFYADMFSRFAMP